MVQNMNSGVFPINFSDDDRYLADFIQKYRNICISSAIQNVSECKYLLRLLGDNAYLPVDDLDEILAKHIPGFYQRSHSTRTRYRRILKICRAFHKEAEHND